MRGDEDRDVAASREIGEQAPEFVARQRIDPRRGLVQDQQLGIVHDRHGQRKTLPHAERERIGFSVGIVDKTDIDQEFGDTVLDVVLGQMKKAGMKKEVLPHGEFAVERERLRHEADAPADRQVAGIDRPSAHLGLSLAGRQQSGQHLHGRGLAAAVGAEEAEDFSALDGEADAIDGGETAETACQILRDDDRSLRARFAWRNDEAPGFRFLSRLQGDKDSFEVLLRRSSRAAHPPCRRQARLRDPSR